jgi:hypothetical protein
MRGWVATLAAAALAGCVAGVNEILAEPPIAKVASTKAPNDAAECVADQVEANSPTGQPIMANVRQGRGERPARVELSLAGGATVISTVITAQPTPAGSEISVHFSPYVIDVVGVKKIAADAAQACAG